MLAFELIVGRPPFERESRSSTYEAIMYRRPHFPLWISDAAREFITLALVKVSSPGLTACPGMHTRMRLGGDLSFINSLLRKQWLIDAARSANLRASPKMHVVNIYCSVRRAC